MLAYFVVCKICFVGLSEVLTMNYELSIAMPDRIIHFKIYQNAFGSFLVTSGRFEIGLRAVLEPPRTPLGASYPPLGSVWAGFGSFKIDLGSILMAFGRVKVILDRLWNDFAAKIGAKISPQ